MLSKQAIEGVLGRRRTRAMTGVKQLADLIELRCVGKVSLRHSIHLLSVGRRAGRGRPLGRPLGRRFLFIAGGSRVVQPRRHESAASDHPPKELGTIGARVLAWRAMASNLDSTARLSPPRRACPRAPACSPPS
jgi:hypothetical protein